MPTSPSAIALAFFFATLSSIIGCRSDSIDSSYENPEPRDASGINFEFSAMGDVAALKLSVQRVSCSGENIEPFQFVDILDVKPGGQLTIDAFFYFNPGCYDIVAQPLTQSGTPSVECEAMFIDQLVVIEGQISEVALAVQCLDKPLGAVDAYAKTTADVVAAQFTLERVSCGNESVKPQTFVEMGNAAASEHPYIEAFFMVPPGCFDLLAAPRRANGTPSAACQSATIHNAIVIDGSTTEISAEFVCP